MTLWLGGMAGFRVHVAICCLFFVAAMWGAVYLGVNLGVPGETRIVCVVRGHEYNPYVRMDLLEVRVYYVFTTTMYEGYA